MIYNRNINKSIILYGIDADKFLESCNISIYKDFVAIGDNTTISIVEARKLLEENGISLYEDHIILEGQQAEDYKKRKAKEAEDRKFEHIEKDLNAQRSVDKADRETKSEIDRLMTKSVGTKRRDYDNARENAWRYHGATKPEYEELSKVTSSPRPKGLFKNEEKRKWDYSKQRVDEIDANNKKFADNVETTKKAYYDHMNDNITKRAIKRHITRHPDMHKQESTIFESVEFI